MISYCDYIAHVFKEGVENCKEKAIGLKVKQTKLDLGSNGEYLSSKKTVHIEDCNGKKYLVTIEDA